MFSRLMDKVLDGFISEKCLVYLDDVIIYGKTLEETLANLILVMAHLREHNLLAKAQKCKLFETSIAFLGPIVSDKGIATHPKKVEKIYNLPAPKDKGGVRSILVHEELLCNYSPSTRAAQEISPFQVDR